MEHTINIDRSGKPFVFSKFGMPIYGLETINSAHKVHYLIYKIVNIENGKTYIGQHHTKDPFDSYAGSGSLICKAIKKYGESAFIKEILFDFATYEEMNAKERELVTLENCYPENQNSYNLREGGSHGMMTADEKRRLKIIHTGKILSSSHRKHIGEASKGKIWVTDGHESLFIDPRNGIPDGYRLGRTVSPESLERMIHNPGVQDRISITNGTITRFIDPNEPIPEGFHRGNHANETRKQRTRKRAEKYLQEFIIAGTSWTKVCKLDPEIPQHYKQEDSLIQLFTREFPEFDLNSLRTAAIQDKTYDLEDRIRAHALKSRTGKILVTNGKTQLKCRITEIPNGYYPGHIDKKTGKPIYT